MFWKSSQSRPETSLSQADEKVRVFEIAQHADVDRKAQRYEPFAQRLLPGGTQEAADDVVRDRHADQQEQEQSAGFVIEIERKQHDIDHPQHDRPPHELVEKGEAGEQEQKQPAGKQDRVQRIVTEYFRYFVANGRNIGHISDFFWVAGTSGNGGQI